MRENADSLQSGTFLDVVAGNSTFPGSWRSLTIYELSLRFLEIHGKILLELGDEQDGNVFMLHRASRHGRIGMYVYA